ncbi:NAD-dependent epimerase/dehydratase family protein [Candidatus Nanosalina sp. VS9-1]|uniref:NAD-dependent epimerase/dehydratase family protein n=1 Tax=Candidatus Nanosalina sp. VS9-1 TaxID=3388566 RepID=UPI0039DF484B
MNILVAGNGFIGRNLVEALREEHTVKTLDRDKATFEQDITENFSIEDEFDVVFHTVGLAPGMHSAKKYRKVHVEGTRNLLKAVETEKFVYISALGADKVDHSYFRTKKEAEDLVKNLSKNYTVFRPSTVFGRGNKLLEMIGKASRTRFFPDFSTEMQPIHIEDFTELLTRSVEDFDGETLEVAGPEEMSLGELAKRIYASRGRKCYRVPFVESFASLGLRISPLPGLFSSENLELLNQRNTVDFNDAEEILGELKQIK